MNISATFRIPLAVVSAVVGLLFLCEDCFAQHACERVPLSRDNLAKWYNPKSEPTDFMVPMPGGMFLTFVPVPLSGSGLFLDEKSTYVMGSVKAKAFAFETPLQVRVGSAVTDSQQHAELLIGKYEFSKGQYAMVMAHGDVAKGIQELSEHSHDPEIPTMLGAYLRVGDPCYQVMTQAIIDYLAQPLTYLTYGDLIAVIDRMNLECIHAAACQRILVGLGRNPDFPGFIRLPSEHEWEFVARGGRDFAEGKLTRDALQADVPFIPSGKTLSNYAHVDKDPSHLEPIGSREGWFGFHDMLGNAEELMGNPFTAENGFGAVGAYVARGGNFRVPSSEIRVSMRVELTLFRRDDATGAMNFQYFPHTGIRLALGLPIVGAIRRTGDDLGTLAQGWAPVSEAGDVGGNTVSDARDLGSLTSKGLEGRDTVSLKNSDAVDYYAFDLNDYATMQLDLTLDGIVQVSFTDEAGKSYLERRIDRSTSAPISTDNLMPQKYYLRFERVSSGPDAASYQFKINRTLIPDTGVPRPETVGLGNAARVDAAGLTYQGFVGKSDGTDVYPVTMMGDAGGLVATVRDQTAPVTLTYLDKRQTSVAKITFAPGQSVQLAAPVSYLEPGFILVTADPNTSTLYTLDLRAKALHDPEFATSFNRARRSASPKKNYSGYVSPSSPKLMMPIKLDAPHKLRVEMTKLDADVDLDLANSDGTPMEGDQHRTGTSPEFFEQSLQAGQYYIVATLKDEANPSRLNIYFDTLEYLSTARSDPAIARAQATSVSPPDKDGDYYNLTNKGAAQYFSFYPASMARMLLTVEVGGFPADADLDLFLEDSNGAVLAKSSGPGDTPETLNYVIPTGNNKFYIRVQPQGTSMQAYYHLAIRGINGMSDPDLSWMGHQVGTEQDWQIYQNGNKCYMVTMGGEIEPALGWLEERPYFYIGVGTGEGGVWFSMQRSRESGGRDVYQSDAISATVTTRSGSSKHPAMSFMPDENDLKPNMTKNCGKGVPSCLDSDAFKLLSSGATINIVGKAAADGADTYISYSLSGYRNAAKKIIALCRAKTTWILGR
ncbi:SUMF1/EgtB/PvdO family nonheme iron enzyme [Mesorhizobium sp. M0323]|uniref:formylglycine-generating enzyme family protein n=1 Tax=Mesorhizobium sp. M0323 TaxID=2956938 RepID=UPI003336C007